MQNNKISDFLKQKTVQLTEDGEGAAAPTTTGDIATNPSVGFPKPEEKKYEKYGNYDVINTDMHNLLAATTAAKGGARYNFTDKNIIDYLKKTGYGRQFIVKHGQHMTKVGKGVRF